MPANTSNETLSILDLYAGCGGLGYGFELTGAFRSIGGVDHYARALQSFYANRPGLAEAAGALSEPVDLADATPAFVRDQLPSHPDVIVGGPPCQGFSFAGPRVKKDERNVHVWKFQEMVLALRPRAFVMENVSGLLVTAQKKRGQILDLLVGAYEDAGFRVTWQVLNAVDYRVPQRRKRLFLVGLRDEARTFAFPPPLCGGQETMFGSEPTSTVGDALDDLPSPTFDEPQDYDQSPRTWLQAFLREGSDKLQAHRPTKHGPDMVKRLEAQERGTRLYPNWNHSWHRLDPSKPSPAVKQNHRAPFVHHREPRSASPRECARLQSFPDRYWIGTTKTDELIQIGNAVPPLLAAAVATALAKALGASSMVTRENGVVPSSYEVTATS